MTRVKRQTVCELLRRVSALTGIERPVIAGSQSIWAVTTDEIPVVERSRDVDVLLTDAPPAALRALGRELGRYSDFNERTGLYVDPVLLAVLALPRGWDTRLEPVVDEEGCVVAMATEVHDTSVAKLVAGREEDYSFIIALTGLGYIDTARLADRAALIESRIWRAALSRNLPGLVERMSSVAVDASPLASVAEALASSADNERSTPRRPTDLPPGR